MECLFVEQPVKWGDFLRLLGDDSFESLPEALTMVLVSFGEGWEWEEVSEMWWFEVPSLH